MIIFAQRQKTKQKWYAPNMGLLTTASYFVFGAAFKLLNFCILGGGQQAPSVRLSKKQPHFFSYLGAICLVNNLIFSIL